MTDTAGTDRARTDEQHRLALTHPEFDGFLVLEVTALVDLDEARVLPVGKLADVLTPHHAIGPLWKGQVRPVDLELHPGSVGEPTTSGLLRIVDMQDEDVAPPVRVTLGTDRKLDCVLAGHLEGPWADADDFERAVSELEGGQGSVRELARRVEALAGGKEDPGWRRGLGRLLG